MKIIRSLKELPIGDFNISIGNFDGLHFGHQKIIRELCSFQSTGLSKRQACYSIIYTFSVHPKIIFSKNKFKLLTTNNEKMQLFSKTKIDFIFLLDEEIYNMDATIFLHKYFPKSTNIKKMIIGKDFRFGFKRGGDVNLLNNIFDNTSIIQLDDVLIKNNKICSSRIRDELYKNNFNFYFAATGMHFTISGVVHEGKKNGRKMGYPTINISPNLNKIIPKPGVYISKIKIGNIKYFSISNLGYNPTVEEIPDTQKLETYIYNLKDNISIKKNEIVCVELIKYIREEIKFTSLDELKKQITKDLQEIKICYI